VDIALIIGPEGGFAEGEIARAQEAGCKSITLGPRILRTETAAIAALSVLMYELGDLGK
jgi:16S rRNA (uracil1498-N3)-methyltransferase